MSDECDYESEYYDRGGEVERDFFPRRSAKTTKRMKTNLIHFSTTLRDGREIESSFNSKKRIKPEDLCKQIRDTYGSEVRVCVFKQES